MNKISINMRSKFEKSIDEETNFLRLGLLDRNQSEIINICFWAALDDEFSMIGFFDLASEFWENLI